MVERKEKNLAQIIASSLATFSKELSVSEKEALRCLLLSSLDDLDRFGYVHRADELLSDHEQQIVASLLERRRNNQP